MDFRGFDFFSLLLLVISVVSPILCRNTDAEWFDTVDVDTTTNKMYGNKGRTTTQERVPDWFPRTRKTTLPSGDETTIRQSFFTHPTNNLTSIITTLLKSFAKLTTSEFSSLEKGEEKEYLINVIRLEIFTIASGNHFILPENANEEVEQKQNKRASAVAALYLDLFCTKDIDAIVSNVTRETVAQHYESRSARMTMNKTYEILQTVFDKLDEALERDTFLDTMYIAEQIRYAARLFGIPAEKKTYFPFDRISRDSVETKTLVEWLNNLDIRKFLIHELFLEMTRIKPRTDSENDEDMISVRSMLKVARERCCMDKMQKLYTSILDEAAKNFIIEDYPGRTSRAFVEKLKKAAEIDEKIKGEWEKKKNEEREELRILRGKYKRVNDKVIAPQ